MYNINQYLAAAIRCGKVSYYQIIKRHDDKYHAQCLEPGINKDYLYKIALETDKLMLYRSLIIVFLLFVTAQTISSSLFFSNDATFLFLTILCLISFFLVIFIFERLTVKAIRNIAQEQVAQDDSTYHNLVVSADFSQFDSFGIKIDSWTFATKTCSQVDGSLIQLPYYFHKELTNIISADIRNIFPKAEFSEKLFINGKDVRKFPELINGDTKMPEPHINPSIVASYVSKENDYLHSYHVISEHACNSQIIVTALVKFRISGEYLYGDIEYYFIPPLMNSLLVLDKYLTIKGFAGFVKTFMKACFSFVHVLSYSLLHIMFLLYSIPYNLLLFFGYDIRAAMIARNPEYNYGHTTLREIYSDNKYKRYFQKNDKERISKLMHTAISDTVIKYLQDKGIDVSDLKQNASIINSGILISGGNVTAGNIYTRVSEVVKRSLKKARK